MSISHDIAIERTSEQGLPAIRRPRQRGLVGGAFWRVVLSGGLALAAVGVGGALVMPNTYSVEHEHVVEADSALVYAYLIAPATWAEWSGVAQGSVRLVGPDLGVGAGISWAEDGTRHRLVLTEVSPQEGVRYELRNLAGEVLRQGQVKLEPGSERTVVTWSQTGSAQGNLFARYLLPLEQRRAEAIAGASLIRLGALAEADHKQAFGTLSVGDEEPLSPLDEVPMARGRSMEFD